MKIRPVLPALVTLGLALIALLPPSASADGAADEAGEPLHDLVDTATQRLQTADPVAASKWLSGGPITDPARVQQVLQSVAADAESSGAPSDFVTSVFIEVTAIRMVAISSLNLHTSCLSSRSAIPSSSPPRYVWELYHFLEK